MWGHHRAACLIPVAGYVPCGYTGSWSRDLTSLLLPLKRTILPLGAPKTPHPQYPRSPLLLVGETIASDGNYFHTAAQEGTNPVEEG